ncbi:chemotaxis protein CheW [Modestobacter marinus]|uniref:Purine-binding chemotaxis protein CheW n=1 Tax=Modestobacter marinus TaxID=477641 RepID=A0A846M3M8_9ACTN|nr:chemotaxis protein CheW [Modestobacter marinus]NIH70229.1 purine-binding chemotaxis protein CheW [Modestobacter marinus]
MNEDVYGLLRLAGTDVALPLSVLREVISCPEVLAPLPAQAIGLLGAMHLRHLVLPVVDLAPRIGRASERRPGQVIVVVSYADQVLGVLADEVRGVTSLGSDRLLPMTAGGQDLLFSHTFRLPETDAVVSVLDAAAVLRVTGAPTVLDVTRDGSSSSADAAGGVLHRSGAERRFTLLECGLHRLALDAGSVHTTLPPPNIRPSVFEGDLCLGVVEFAGREVPIVDPLVLLGLGRLTADQIGAGLVLNLGQGYVVLALTSLLDLVEVTDTDVLRLPGAATSGDGLLSAMVDVARVGPCLVLDEKVLSSHRDLIGLASMNTVIDGAETPTTADLHRPGTSSGAGLPYVVYSAGADVATPLEQVVEILSVPDTLTPTSGSMPGLLGVMVHRQAAIPVVSLARVLGREPLPISTASCLLLVSVDQQVVAFAIDRLRAIESLTWTDQDRPPASATSLTRLLQSAPLVQIGSEARLIPDLNLQALVQSLQPPLRDRPVEMLASSAP